MKTKATIFVIFILSWLAANAHEGDRDIDLRAGLGLFKLKEGNALLVPIELEMNAKLSNYFVIAPSVAYNIINEEASSNSGKFFQANLNAFVSPFRNNRRNDFRIGSGLSFYKYSEPAVRSAFGLNLIIEDSYMINNRFFIGMKTFVQPYFNKQISWGVLLKVGINL